MDKLSNEISFSSDSPQQVEPVRGSGTSATSHLLLTNRINVRACHVRSGVVQGVLQWCFYTAYGAGWCPAAFSSVLCPCFGDTRRQTLLCQFTSPNEPDSGRWRKRSPGRWLRTVRCRQTVCWQTDRDVGCRRSYEAQQGPEDSRRRHRRAC